MAFCCLFSLYGAKQTAVTLRELVFPSATGTADFWVEEFVCTLTHTGCFVDEVSKKEKKKKERKKEKEKACPVLCFQTLPPIRKCLIKMHHVIRSCFSLRPVHLDIWEHESLGSTHLS